MPQITWGKTITGIGLAGGILAYFTPWPSIWEAMKALTDAMNADKVIVNLPNEPAKSLVREDFSEFTPILWLSKSPSGDQEIYAERPAKFPQFINVPTLVLLHCNAGNSCIAEKVFNIPRSVGHVESLSKDINGNLVALNGFGDGVLYKSKGRKYAKFYFKLPCARDKRFERLGRNPGGMFSVRNMYLADDSLKFTLQAVGCHGLSNIAGSAYDSGVNIYQENIKNSYFEFLGQIKFDVAGYVSSGDIVLNRVNSADELSPEWFSFTSNRQPTGKNFYPTPDGYASKDQLEVAHKMGLIYGVLSKFSEYRSFVYPNMPTYVYINSPGYSKLNSKMKYNAYSSGFATSENLVGAIDDTQNGSGANATYFTDKGIISVRQSYGPSFISYAAIANKSASDGWIVVKYDDFFLPASTSEMKSTVKIVIDGLVKVQGLSSTR